MSMSFKASPDGTYGEILVNGQVVAKLPVTGNAVIPNLVGTVSQSGGVPTGAVVERGSNANGSYARFADGTQICTHGVSLGAVTVSAQNNVFADPTNRTWTYPAAFTATPGVFVGGSDATNQFTWGTAASPSSSVTFWKLFCAFSGSPQMKGELLAIGRWF